MTYHRSTPYPNVPRDVTDYGLFYSKLDRSPLNADDYDRVSPLFPYPAIARYRGKGDPKVADSYVKSLP